MENIWEVAITGSSNEDTVYLWELRSGTIIESYKGNKSANSSTSLTTIGNDYFVSTQGDKPAINIYTWGRELPIHTCPLSEKIGPICSSKSGNYVAAGGLNSGSLYLWEVSTGSLLRHIDAHYNRINAVSFTHDDSLIITGGEDGIVSAWSVYALISKSHKGPLRKATPFATWSDHTLPISSIYVGFGGVHSRIISASLDRTARILDIGTKTSLAVILFPSAITCCSMDPCEVALFVGATDGNIYQSDLQNASGGDDSQQPKIFKSHTKPVTSMCVSFDGSLLISGSLDGNCNVWDIYSRQVIRTFSQKAPISTLCVFLNPIQPFSSEAKTLSPIKSFNKYTKSLEQSSPTATVDLCGLVSDRKEQSLDNYLIGCGTPIFHTSTTKSTEKSSVIGSSSKSNNNNNNNNNNNDNNNDNEEIVELKKEMKRLQEENERWKDVANRLYSHTVKSTVKLIDSQTKVSVVDNNQKQKKKQKK